MVRSVCGRHHHDDRHRICGADPRRAPRNPVAEIERALEAGEFIPYYQPIVDIRSGQLRGAKYWFAGASRTAPLSCRVHSFH